MAAKINQTQTSAGGCLGLSRVRRKLNICGLRSAFISTATGTFLLKSRSHV